MFRVFTVCRNLLRRRRVEREIENELSTAFEWLVEEKVRAGMLPDRARRAARLEFGSHESVKDQIRDARRGAAFDRFAQDLRYGFRLVRKNPAFSCVAILTLALGTGANSAIFQLVNALRLRPLPVERPDELVSVGIDRHGRARIGRTEQGRSVFSEPLWQEIRSQQRAFSPVFAWGSGRWDLSTRGESRWADGYYVSGEYFDALGVRAHVGRLLTQADDRKACGSPGAVLSHRFWQQRYGGDPGVIGRSITLDGRSFDVIGVTQRGFLGVEVGRAFDVALPLCAEPLLRGREAGTGRRDVWWLDIMGRLKAQWTLERAGAHLALVSPGVFEATVSPTYTPDRAKGYTASTLTATSGRSGVSLLPPVAYLVLWVLLGATGIVLLLTCANLANLMLARSTARSREVAVRLALGATRTRIVAQLLTEGGVIAFLGTVSGFVLGRWISQALVTFLNSGALPVNIVVDLSLDGRVFALTTGIAGCICVLSSLGPARRASRRNSATVMQPGGRLLTDGRDAVMLHRGLVVVQLALSIVLVVGALLFVRTLQKLNDVDLGFDPHVVVASVDLHRTEVRPTERMRVFDDIVERIHAVSGVRAAAETVIVPLSGSDWNGSISKHGEVQIGQVHFNAVGPGYFDVMKLPLLRGRAFDHRDQLGAARAAVVNETFVRRYFARDDPIGQTFRTDGRPAEPYEIVGLVRDSTFVQVGEERMAIAYLAASQEMVPTPASLRIVVRTDVQRASITPALTRAIIDAAPGVAVSYETVSRYIDTTLLPQRFVAWLSSLFGVLAVLVASIGLYGVLSYLVTRRRIEIGVRMALGAEPRTIVRMIVAESGLLVCLGLGIGIALAAVASRSTAGLLYGLKPLDPMSFALGAGVLASVGLLAAWLPARRASTVAPMVALRE